MYKKIISIFGLILPMLISLSGCSYVGSKSANMSTIYVTTTILSLLLLFVYILLVKKKEHWFLLLFSAVAVVNIGYLSLSLSDTLNEALLANRIAYLGSVFLPVSMLMTILKTCKITLNKWMIGTIMGVSIIVFLIAASPGYLDIYYKEVSLITVNGMSVLEKVYGPLHSVYLYYLILHFASMIGIIIYAKISKRIVSIIHASVILCAVLVNISVWLMEQLIKFDFEFLSVSYIVSELFLLGISLVIQESSIRSALISNSDTKPEHRIQPIIENKETELNIDESEAFARQCEYFKSKICTLTPTEREIYELYLKHKGTKDIMAELCITENTVKYHNKNIYSKLGVTSRKQLLLIAEAIKNKPVSV